MKVLINIISLARIELSKALHHLKAKDPLTHAKWNWGWSCKGCINQKSLGSTNFSFFKYFFSCLWRHHSCTGVLEGSCVSYGRWWREPERWWATWYVTPLHHLFLKVNFFLNKWNEILDLGAKPWSLEVPSSRLISSKFVLITRVLASWYCLTLVEIPQILKGGGQISCKF